MTAPSSNYLITQVIKKVNDSSFERETHVLPAMNKCLRLLSRRIKFPDLLSDPTDLTCTASTISSSMPDNFGHHLVQARNTTNSILNGRVKIWRSFAQFSAKFFDFDHSPPVAHVCPVGKTLWFQGKPTSDETLKVIYTKAPTLYTSDATANDLTATPQVIAIIDWLPEDYQEELLVNFATAEFFDQIEQGNDGTKVNYNKYSSRFYDVLDELEEHIRPLMVDEGPDFATMTNHEFSDDPIDELY